MALSDKVFASGSVEAGISNTKLRQEQMKSELGFTTLAGDVFALSKQIEDIIGDGNWKANVSGLDVQLVDLAAHIDADKLATEMEIKQDLLVTGAQHNIAAVQLDSTLNVDGTATVASAVVEDLVAAVGAIVTHDGAGALQDDASFKFDGSHLFAPGVKVSDLTPGRVVFVGASEELADETHMTYAAGVLTVSGSTFSKDVGVAGNLTVQGNFVVEGDTVTQNVTTVTTQDSIVTLNKDAASIPAGGVGIEFEAGAAIVGYVKSNGSGDLLMQAATGGELTLDVGGNHEITVDGNLAVELASAINQDVTTDATPEFNSVELTGLSASRLAATSAGKVLESINLIDWSAGDSNITVADDTEGGITISLDPDLEIDSIKLADESAYAGYALKVGADGLVTHAAWDEFFTVEAGKGLSIAVEGFKVALSQSQDLRSSASPEFAALNLGSYGDLLSDGSDFKILANAALLFEDTYRAGSSFSTALKLAGSSAEWSAIETAYGSEKTLLGMLAAAAPAANKRMVKVQTLASSGNDVFVGAGDAGGAFPTGAAEYQNGKSDVYVNGQKQVEGNLKDFEFMDVPGGPEKVKINFKYTLQVGDVVELIRYPSAAK